MSERNQSNTLQVSPKTHITLQEDVLREQPSKMLQNSFNVPQKLPKTLQQPSNKKALRLKKKSALNSLKICLKKPQTKFSKYVLKKKQGLLAPSAPVKKIP